MKFFSIMSLGILISLAISTGIYNYSVPKIEGGSQALTAYQGKKVLVITLPVQQDAAADSMLYSLDTLASAHLSHLAVIAVPGYEDGYAEEMKSQLQQWYRSKLGNYITITEGLYTRKTSGSQQHPLFAWLTHSSQNGSLDVDVEGPGSKFFADSEGKLYGVLGPKMKIGGRLVQRTLLFQ